VAHVCRNAVWAYVTVFREVLGLPENKVVVACSPTVCSHGILLVRIQLDTDTREVRDRCTNKSRFISILLSIQPLNLASIELDPFLWESSYKSSDLLPASASIWSCRETSSIGSQCPASLPDAASRSLFGNAAPNKFATQADGANPTRNANIWADTGSTIVGRGGLS
jgi:hypothetical protein